MAPPLRRRPRTSMVFVASCMTALWRSQSSGMFSALFSRIRKQPRSHRPDIALTPFVSRPSLRRCRHARRLPSLSDLVFGGRCLAMTFVPERFAGGLEPLNNAAQGLQNKDGGLSRDIRGVIAGLRSRLSHDRSETTPSQTKPRSRPRSNSAARVSAEARDPRLRRQDWFLRRGADRQIEVERNRQERRAAPSTGTS